MSAIDRLYEILREHDGPVRRKWIEQTRLAFRPAKPSPEKLRELEEVDEIQPDFHGERKVLRYSNGRAKRRSESAVHEISLEGRPGGEADAVTERQPIAALFMTPSAHDVSRLNEVYAGKVQYRCLSFGSEVAAISALIVSAKLGVLMSMQKVFEDWGFIRCCSIHLLSEPIAPNVTECAALAFYERGGLTCNGTVRDWPVDPDASQLADLLLKGVDGRRVHLFAKSESLGWESIVGAENWQIDV